MQKKENPFVNILFNILLPVVILNNAHEYFPQIQAVTTLLIALSFPLIYGGKDYLLERKVNWISIMGLVGILLTGGFALLQLEGIFFAIKEAAIPLIIGLITVGSVLYKKPFMLLLIKSTVFNKELIFQKLEENKKEKAFAHLMNSTTLCCAGSFFISAILNFFIAQHVFRERDSLKTLNEQIATMTWLGYVVIALPLSLVSGLILWYLVKSLKKITCLSFNEMIIKN